ncbi:MAG: hypothetical protein KGH58_02800 [Candidatus Micrarchaeota archaeon]|nr:hypothetical protein [Candidatus Micrarchaeota archaeon]
MELKITSERENPLLKRKEITFSISHEAATMSKAEILKEVSKKLSLNPENTIVIKVDQQFGAKSSTGIAHSYESRQDLERLESKHVLKRAGITIEEKKPEAKKEEKAEAKEEKKEEKKE